MPLSARILFTAGALASTLIVLFISPRDRMPAWMWRGGKNDPVRRLLFDDDGNWLPRGKKVVVAFNIFFVVLVWLLPSEQG